MRMTIAIAILAATRLLASPPPTASPDKMLEAAIYQAKVLGDLPGAIQQLESIAARYAGQPVAARALAEIGRAEELLGHTARAREAYTRVVKDYRDQTQLVAEVRRSLGAITNSTGGPLNLSFEQGEPGTVPDGWVAPMARDGYTAELRRTDCRGTIGCAVVLVPSALVANRFGNLMQSFSAVPYRGKTVQLRAWLRLESVSTRDSAQMWLRVDRPNRELGFLDNMQERPIHSAVWTEAQIVGRIGNDADTINLGVMSIGAGRAWVDEITFEIVPDSTPVTGIFELRNMPKEPVNPSFEAGETGSVPNGWLAAVGKVALERLGCRSAACASVWLPEGASHKFGNIMQTLNAANYRGKTVRVRAWLREDATTPTDSAQMWFRVDRPNHLLGAFDNMDDRPVKSAVWTPAEIIGKVAVDAEALNIGVMSVGKGRAWVDAITLEVVPDSTPATGVHPWH